MNEDEGFKTCNYTMDADTLDRLEAISRFRETGSPQAPKRYRSHSLIVRDAVKALYHYEVLQQNLLHPKGNRADGHWRP
ncbi:MAG: hypothetical protein IJ087_16220 [Eggerthellaceae bacterium]|nr:hypothetical protein [Eggerthellaceae bacterium]